MGMLAELFVILLFVLTAFGQYNYNYYNDRDYDPEPDDEYPPAYHFNPNIQYGIPHVPYVTDCARECFCPPTFPLTMLCDNRKLKTMPYIPAHIQQLHLQFNNIESVTAKSFINATNLREINLSHNKLMSNMIDDGVFAKLPHLAQLYLHHNNLQEIPSPLPNTIERLFLGFNKISRLQRNVMQGLVNMTMLDLCNNHLDDSAVKGRGFSKLKKLMQLNLCNNKLNSMPPDLPSSLMYLSLENNSISSIPDKYFDKLPYIHTIRMSHNNLQEVPLNVFNVSNLVELSLGHNKLKQVFHIPKSLEHLYLQDNELEIINATMLCPTIDPMNNYRLTYLRVEKNKLKASISTYVLFCFPHIQSIYYGEQKVKDAQNPILPQFPMPHDHEEEEEEERGAWPVIHEEEEEEEEHGGIDHDDFNPYSY
ncbi:osteomodulin [Microcaecilia unicolor]|uniref:Osteomodulin n=1 Tax=Microcaecilia unicolor TaxID=1415580 RepID=A0A6P7YJ74_9AMPH|nr:osteomodulin [Microcaecilia unicolor]